jgi:hypothetical protein
MLPLRIYHASHLIFLVVLALFIVTMPFLATFPRGQLINTAFLTLVMVSGLMVIEARRGTLLLAMVLVVPGIVASWINHYRPESMPAVVHLTCAGLFLVLVSVEFLRFILQSPRVTVPVLEAGISTYLVFGLLWALAYMMVDGLSPKAFAFSVAGDSMAQSAIYYSFVTLTTMGYGDIAPISRVARMLAMSESTTGVMYMSILIARLVGLYSTVTPIEGEKGDTDGSRSGRGR